MEFFWDFNNTALICSSDRGKVENVKLLLAQEGIDVNIKDIWNQNNFYEIKAKLYFFIILIKQQFMEFY